MSYLHCPTCKCAYNVATQPACPRCGVTAGVPADAALAVVAAAEQLARAVARATPAELARAQAELAVREAARPVPSPGALPRTGTALLRALRGALGPARPVVDNREPVVTGLAHQALLTTVTLALLTRLPARPAAWALEHVLPRVTAARARLS